MRICYCIILGFMIMLLVQLFAHDGGLPSVFTLRSQLQSLQKEMGITKVKNERLMSEIDDLKNNLASIESIARRDLGYIKQGEIYVRITHDNKRTDSTTG